MLCEMASQSRTLSNQKGKTKIFESSRFAAELGAAIHLQPNVVALLRRFGMRPEEVGANNAEWVSVLSSQGDVISRRPLADLESKYKYVSFAADTPTNVIHSSTIS